MTPNREPVAHTAASKRAACHENGLEMEQSRRKVALSAKCEFANLDLLQPA
jgi:hypothetical protein